MVGLTDLGFSKGCIFETVLSTYDVKGEPNAAPMGITMKNQQSVTIRLYNSSQTYHNLCLTKCAVVNITSDVQVFFQTAFKEPNTNARIPLEWFEKAETVNAPRLCVSEALVEVSLVKLTPIDAGRTLAICKVELVRATKSFPKVYCRALFATVEAIVDATRIKVFLTGTQKQREQVKVLLERIAYCGETVARVAPDSRYSEIMRDLTRRINSWRSQSESLR